MSEDDGGELLPALEAVKVNRASNEELRYASIQGLEAILGSWLARRNLSAGQLRLLRAHLALWRAASPETLAALKEHFDREPVG